MLIQREEGQVPVYICDFCGMSSLHNALLTVKDSAAICENCASRTAQLFAERKRELQQSKEATNV